MMVGVQRTAHGGKAGSRLFGRILRAFACVGSIQAVGAARSVCVAVLLVLAVVATLTGCRRDVSPLSPDALLKDVAAMLDDGDIDHDAISSLIGRWHDSRAVVLRALESEDPLVRLAAIYVLQDHPDVEPEFIDAVAVSGCSRGRTPRAESFAECSCHRRLGRSSRATSRAPWRTRTISTGSVRRYTTR